MYITKHYIAGNVDPRFSLGNNERDGHAELFEVELPDGYTVRDTILRDPDGYECGIYVGKGGRPKISSKAGSCPDVQL
ncbi:hypothetical protein [Pleomorphomonas sp. PLEO]|uniref:hypothetical protein n=1 Tax=Pleomorphomonas sp. PLEO TaxID=3239306 RepID=UPI00351E9287